MSSRSLIADAATVIEALLTSIIHRRDAEALRILEIDSQCLMNFNNTADDLLSQLIFTLRLCVSAVQHIFDPSAIGL
jgi:hypothetical protein